MALKACLKRFQNCQFFSCSQSKCLCNSFLIDQLIEELKTGFWTDQFFLHPIWCTEYFSRISIFAQSDLLISINEKTLLKREGFHSEYAHANDFDYASQCAIGTDFARSHSKENTPDQCCGDYPTRFPFMSKDGIHKCCGSKIFNPEYTVKFLKSVWSSNSDW